MWLSRLIVVVLIIVFSSFGVYAQDDVDIRADHVHYETDTNYLAASGNVKVLFDDYNVSTNEFVINYNKRQFDLIGPYHVVSSENNLSGEDLTFKYLENYGYGRNLDSTLGVNRIKGESFEVSTDNVVVSKGYYTSCTNRDHKHYYFNSGKLELYPRYGLVLLKDASLYLFDLPVLYMPVFVAGSKRYSVLRSVSAIPEVGSDERDGVYAKQRFGYFVDESNTGAIALEYYTKRGIRAGVSHQYIHSNSLSYITSFYYTPRYKYPDNYEADVTMQNLWGFAKPKEEENLFDRFFIFNGDDAQSAVAQTNLEFAYRKYISYQHVTFVPRFEIEIKEFDLLGLCNARSSVEFARLSENKGTYTNKRSATADFDRRISFLYGSLTPGLHIERSESTYTWNKALANLRYNVDFAEQYFLKLKYEHVIKQSGQRTFLYESYDVFDVNNIDIKIGKRIKQYKVSLRHKYNTEHIKLLESEADISYNFDCLMVGLSYHFIKNEIKFKFSIN